MKFSVAFAAVLVGFVSAQSSASGTASAAVPSQSISSCILQCSNQAASSAGCTSFTDLSCVCTSTKFQTDAGTCIQQKCPNEMSAATELQKQLCASVSASGSAATATATSPASGSASHSGSSTASHESSASASATRSSNAAAGLPAFDFGAAGIWSVVALGGAAVAQLAL
ncbi:CFEM domain protein [Ceratobasidium sp. AG-Ba]|nr:CFEM domain protein [Ceratobasidium sp. AG-Ba]QRW12649.1 CFEM domain protein [Ceratobasidium sp. AG-Ba]